MVKVRRKSFLKGRDLQQNQAQGGPAFCWAQLEREGTERKVKRTIEFQAK